MGVPDTVVRSRGIPLVHQIIVAEPFRRRGVATRLMDVAEQLARGRGACQDQRPLSEGARVTMDHDLIMWLTKDLAR